jgi:hypothetical protein
MIKPEGGVKVVDFGIAQIEGPEATRLTRAGAMLGTPAYMAPEQLLGATVDARADIYAWGILLSEMLTGRHPLRGQHEPSHATGPFAAIIGRCLLADPSMRFGSARELLLALEWDQAVPRATHASPVPERTVDDGGRTDTRFWWEFHQGVVALIYWLMTIPGWYARGQIGGWQGRAFFIVLLATIVVAANARLHLWFTSRFYPGELEWVHKRSSRWIRIADWAFAATLAIGAVLIADERSPWTIVLPSVAVGAVVGFLLIEPVTTRDAFKRSGIAN